MSKHFTKWSITQLDDAIFDHNCTKATKGECACIAWQQEIDKRYKKQTTRHKFKQELADLEFINQERHDDAIYAH